jgi:hypothetical protein
MATENESQNLTQAVESAYGLVDKILISDAEYAESKVKYSAWIAALATAGFGLLVSNHEKLSIPALSHPKLSGMLFISSCTALLLAVAASAIILGVSNRHLASFKSERTLVCQRSFIIKNHIKVFQADAEVRLVMAGVPSAFIPDKIFADLVAVENGALTEIGYGESAEYERKAAKQGYQQEQTSKEFQLLEKMQSAIEGNLRQLRGTRHKDEKLLTKLFVGQEALVALGYIGLLALAILAQPK